jgi:hypothetical protein
MNNSRFRLPLTELFGLWLLPFDEEPVESTEADEPLFAFARAAAAAEAASAGLEFSA